jgi:Zn-dependent protease/CBS domain-containing protein
MSAGFHHRRRQAEAWSFPLVRIAGIQVRVHVTFLLLLLLFVWAEAQPGGLGVAGGLVWLLMIFGCVLVHELAHSVVARSRGAEVDSIVLLPIGGVSRLRHVPKNWLDELWIAAVGPLASFAIAGAAALLSWILGLHLLPATLYQGALLPRLVWLNLLLGGFNLLPAFPLDGGRVLNAILERRHDRLEATHTAAVLGRALAVVMGLVGLYWNVWLVVIAIFIWLGASAEENAAVVRATLRGRRVSDVMRTDAIVLDARLPVAELEGMARPSGQHQFPVVRDGVYDGLLDDSDTGRGRGGLAVGDLTDHAAPALDPAEDLGDDGLDDLAGSDYPALAVVDQQRRVVGLLRLEDVARLARRSH